MVELRRFSCTGSDSFSQLRRLPAHVRWLSFTVSASPAQLHRLHRFRRIQRFRRLLTFSLILPAYFHRLRFADTPPQLHRLSFTGSASPAQAPPAQIHRLSFAGSASPAQLRSHSFTSSASLAQLHRLTSNGSASSASQVSPDSLISPGSPDSSDWPSSLDHRLLSSRSD